MENNINKVLLNSFYTAHVKKRGISPQEYKEQMTEALGVDPMKADYKAIHDVQFNMLREFEGGKR